jgi:hypothetical protein
MLPSTYRTQAIFQHHFHWKKCAQYSIKYRNINYTLNEQAVHSKTIQHTQTALATHPISKKNGWACSVTYVVTINNLQVCKLIIASAGLYCFQGFLLFQPSNNCATFYQELGSISCQFLPPAGITYSSYVLQLSFCKKITKMSIMQQSLKLEKKERWFWPLRIFEKLW